MFGKKKLVARLSSLEEYLGVRFSPSSGKEDFSEGHLSQEWGVMHDLLKMREEWNKKQKK